MRDMSDPSVAYTFQEFHRRRTEAEMERALAAGKPSVAMLHLELARMHREKRKTLGAELDSARLLINPPRCFNGTDKEG